MRGYLDKVPYGHVCRGCLHYVNWSGKAQSKPTPWGWVPDCINQEKLSWPWVCVHESIAVCVWLWVWDEKPLQVLATLLSHNHGLQPGTASQINPLSLPLLLSGYVITPTGNETKTGTEYLTQLTLMRTDWLFSRWFYILTSFLKTI